MASVGIRPPAAVSLALGWVRTQDVRSAVLRGERDLGRRVGSRLQSSSCACDQAVYIFVDDKTSGNNTQERCLLGCLHPARF